MLTSASMRTVVCGQTFIDYQLVRVCATDSVLFWHALDGYFTKTCKSHGARFPTTLQVMLGNFEASSAVSLHCLVQIVVNTLEGRQVCRYHGAS